MSNLLKIPWLATGIRTLEFTISIVYFAGTCVTWTSFRSLIRCASSTSSRSAATASSSSSGLSASKTASTQTSPSSKPREKSHCVIAVISYRFALVKLTEKEMMLLVEVVESIRLYVPKVERASYLPRRILLNLGIGIKI